MDENIVEVGFCTCRKLTFGRLRSSRPTDLGKKTSSLVGMFGSRFRHRIDRLDRYKKRWLGPAAASRPDMRRNQLEGGLLGTTEARPGSAGLNRVLKGRVLLVAKWLI